MNILKPSDKFFRAEGCSQCDNTGYKGRIGIYEILKNDIKS
jgi:type II secretory ATPase GspE/PulE/Tfp pilus assembly ATPase PilB-like protein